MTKLNEDKKAEDQNSIDETFYASNSVNDDQIQPLNNLFHQNIQNLDSYLKKLEPIKESNPEEATSLGSPSKKKGVVYENKKNSVLSHRSIWRGTLSN